jgi:hypothetical protein
MDQTIDTVSSVPGEGFTARVQAPLVDASDNVIVAQGAIVRGHVTELMKYDTPRIRVSFDSVDTTRGPATFAALIKTASSAHYPGPITWRPSYSGYPYGYSYGYPYYGYGAIGGGPWGYGYEPYQPWEVHLPAGGTLQVELTRPIVPPGTQVNAH